MVDAEFLLSGFQEGIKIPYEGVWAHHMTCKLKFVKGCRGCGFTKNWMQVERNWMQVELQAHFRKFLFTL